MFIRLFDGAITIEVTMKINDVNRPLPSTTGATTGRPSPGVATDKSLAATPGVGSVSISETSRSLQTSGASKTEAPFDAERVGAIKDAISAGQFKVNPEAVADKLIASASQLLVDQ